MGRTLHTEGVRLFLPRAVTISEPPPYTRKALPSLPRIRGQCSRPAQLAESGDVHSHSSSHKKKDAALTGLGFLEYIELNAGIFHLLDAMPL